MLEKDTVQTIHTVNAMKVECSNCSFEFEIEVGEAKEYYCKCNNCKVDMKYEPVDDGDYFANRLGECPICGKDSYDDITVELNNEVLYSCCEDCAFLVGNGEDTLWDRTISKVLEINIDQE